MTKPTHADKQLALTVWSCFPDNPIGREIADAQYEAAKLIATHVAQAVNAEMQRMCDVAYDIYNTDKDKTGEWMDGAYAVIEAIGKEVK